MSLERLRLSADDSGVGSVKRLLTMDAAEAMDAATAAYLKALARSRLFRFLVLATGIGGFIFAVWSLGLQTALILYAAVGIVPVFGYAWGRLTRR